jgi:hypothetical protein
MFFTQRAEKRGDMHLSHHLLYTVRNICSGRECVRASREKSGNHLLAFLPTSSYKYVHVMLCIQSCPILREETFPDVSDASAFTYFRACCCMGPSYCFALPPIVTWTLAVTGALSVLPGVPAVIGTDIRGLPIK